MPVLAQPAHGRHNDDPLVALAGDDRRDPLQLEWGIFVAEHPRFTIILICDIIFHEVAV